MSLHTVIIINPRTALARCDLRTGFAASIVPATICTGSVFYIIVVSISFTLPFAQLFFAAKFGTERDKLMNSLNQLRLRGKPADKDRVAHLYYTTCNLNNQQGLGVLLFVHVVEPSYCPNVCVLVK